MLGSNKLTPRAASLTVRARLIALVLVVVAAWLLSLVVTTAGFESTKSSADAAARAFQAFSAERDAYEGWLTQDDQSNMAAAVATLQNPKDASLYKVTWAQAWQGHTQAVQALSETSHLTRDPKVLAALAQTDRDLAAYTHFTTLTQADADRGDPTSAVYVMSVENANISNKTQADFNLMGTLLSRQAAAVRAKVSSTASSSLLLLLLIALVSLPLAAVAVALIIRSITRPLALVTSAAERISQGDLEVSVEASDRRDELSRMSRAFAAMLAHLQTMAAAALEIASGNLTVRVEPKSPSDSLGHAFLEMREKVATMIRSISENADTVTSTANQMAEASEESGRAVGEIAQAVSSVASGAERQVRSVQVARQVTDEVAAASELTVVSAQETLAAAAQARELARDGLTAAGRASAAIEQVRATTGEVTESIRALGVKSEQIGGFVETITGIAAQTHLLALNAAIEAARAGDQGRGFAVVADEVRKLAEESQSAAATITELIDQIQAETARAVEVAALGVGHTDGGVETVAEATATFQRIGESVEQVAARVEEISEAIQRIAATGGTMQESIEQVSSVAEQTSASSQEVSAGAQETSASTQQIAASAQQLAETAEQLAQLVAQFSLD